MPANTLGFGDIVLRLAIATLSGCLIGLNRDLHHKGAGMRTFGLVSLATAGITIGTLLAVETQGDNIGRVVQGVLTGVGFLGAGVIMHRADTARVTGLTTAAAIWLSAAISVVCGLGELTLVAVLVAFALALLTLGLPVERLAERVFGRAAGAEQDGDEDGR